MTAESQTSDARTQIANAERLTRVETKIEGIEESIKVIRDTNHQINGKMQQFVVAEQHHGNTIAVMSGQISKLETTIAGLKTARERQVGAWASWTIAGAALVGAVAIISGIAFTIVEFLGQHPIKP